MAAPKWLSLSEDRGAVNLRWFRVQGAVKYVVQRRQGEKGEFQEIGTSVNPAFDDHKVEGGLFYFYRIIPVDRQDVQGPISEIRYYQVPLPEPLLLVPPEWAAHLQDQNSISLSWSHQLSKQVLAFNLYRKQEGSDSFNLLTSTLNTNFRDRSLRKGSTYHYVLTALDMKLQESDYSSILTVTFADKSEAGPEYDPLSSVKILEDVVQLTEPVTEYGWEKYGFVSPTDLVYLPDEGTLYVSDAATGYVTAIDSTGEVASRFGGMGQEPWEFERLLGIGVDNRGYVYATDAYRGELAVFNSRGVYTERISLAEEVQRYFGEGMMARFPWFRFGIVDVVAMADGGMLIVDNPNGWVYQLDSVYRLVNVIGERGYEPGKMQYPTFSTVDRKGTIFVSDTLNSRVQIFQADGTYTSVLGGRGLGVGQFQRPKGIALDGRGNIYVADSQHNVIQVFNKEWEFYSLLGDERGLPLDLGSPNGLLFVEPDLIMICEKLSRRIQVRRLMDTFASDIISEELPQKGINEERILAPAVIQPVK